jgi:glutamate dehydrogenase (NAD(P)+)
MPAASFARLASTAAVPEREAFDAIEQRIRGNTRQVLEVSGRDANVPRAAALALAAERVRAAMQTRRWR